MAPFSPKISSALRTLGNFSSSTFFPQLHGVDEAFGYEFYATAEILQFRLSLLKQSKPSILTAAGLWPKLIRTQPLAEEEEEGDKGVIENGLKLPLPNCSSWITGFEALLGGDPQKYGGENPTWLPDLSAKLSLGRIISRSSARTTPDGSSMSDWWLNIGRLMDLMWSFIVETFKRPKRRGLGQTIDSFLISSQLVQAFCWFLQQFIFLFLNLYPQRSIQGNA